MKKKRTRTNVSKKTATREVWVCFHKQTGSPVYELRTIGRNNKEIPETYFVGSYQGGFKDPHITLCKSRAGRFFPPRFPKGVLVRVRVTTEIVKVIK